MAKSARQLEDPVYDPDSEKPVTKPDLARKENISSVPAEQLERIPTMSDEETTALEERRSANGAPTRNNLSAAETSPQHEAQLGLGYTGGTSGPGRFRIKGYMIRRRAFVSGGLISAIVAFVLFLIASGPLEFIHLSQILQRNFFGTNNTVQIRNKGLLRYARSGNIEETRLGMLGSKVYNNTLSQLKQQGMEFTDKNARGVPRKFTIDTSKNDNYKDLSQSELEDTIRKDFGGDAPDKLPLTKTGPTNYEIQLDNTSLKGLDFTKATARTAIGSLNNGKIETGLATRYVKQAWDLPKLFSPLQKLKSAALNKLVGGGLSEKQAADEIEKERLTQLEETVTTTPEAVEAKTDVKGALDKFQSTLNRLIIAQAGLCAVRGAANSAVTLNRALIVLPATVQAADKIAVGSQVQSGQDFDGTQLEAVHDSFTNDKGQSIWDARALKATEGDTTPTGPDLPIDYAEAFSGKTTADQIRDDIKVKVLGIDLTSAACSKAGLAVGVITGIAALLLTIPSDGATAAGYAAWIGENAASAIAVGGLLYMFQTHLTDLLQDKALVPATLSGPLGGNLMAYGARELSNTAARSMGGVALDNTQKSVLSYDEEQQYQKEFSSESISKRLFDVYDSRSTISKLIDHTSPSVTDNLSMMGGILTNFRAIAAHSFASVFPRAVAATPYDWGFPKYGIPSELAEDKNYEDPYDNGDKVAKLLDDAGCDTNVDCTWRSRAMGCFGVDINKDSGQWTVVAQEDVNPGSDEYAKANCGDISEDWHRLMLFVMDSRIMDTIACHQNADEQSCVNLDESSSGSSTSSTSGTSSTGSGKLPSGTSKELAQQLLPFIAQGKIFCGSAAGGSGPANCSDIQNTAKGQPLGGNCQVDSLTPHLLGLILVLVRDDDWRLGISAMCSDHHLEGDGPYAGHSYGSTADFSIQNGASGAAAAANQDFVDDAASILSASGGSFGQIQCHPDYPVLDNKIFTTFEDKCTHQHIRAAP